MSNVYEWGDRQCQEIDALTKTESGYLLFGFAVFVIGVLAMADTLVYLFA